MPDVRFIPRALIISDLNMESQTVYPNKVALITGAGKRMGRYIALECADSGFDIIVHYNTASKDDMIKTVDAVTSKGREAIPFKADLSKPEEIYRIFRYINSRFKRLDLMINSAGIFEKIDFFDITSEFIDRFINTNLKSTMICSVEAARIMETMNTNEPMRIINIASLGAIENWTGYIPYSVSKAGVIKFTKLAAKRLAPKILVNAIAPGTIVIDDDENKTVDYSLEKNYPMKRFGTTKDITSLIRFLITQNKYITGHTFVVDGGKIL